MSGMTTTGASVAHGHRGARQVDGHVAAASPSGSAAWASSCSPSRCCRACASAAAAQLVESEMPGPEYEPLTASIRDTARRLWLLYVGLTALMILILAVFGWTGVDELMTPYQAAAHAFTTMPTGGFSPQAALGRAVRGREPVGDRASSWCSPARTSRSTTGVPAASAVNPLRDEEFRWYLVIILVASARSSSSSSLGAGHLRRRRGGRPPVGRSRSSR